MSGSDRKRISMWDLKEVPHLLPVDIHNNAGPGRPGKLVHSKESQPGWHSPEIAGSNDPKWYGAEANSKNCRKVLDATMVWDGDVSYSTKMSPGLDDWRQQKSNRPTKSGCGRSYRNRSRSRSRSPEHGFKRELGSNDRSIVAQPCKDFAAGRCRRGDHCPYLHQDDTDFEDKRYSEGGLVDSWEGRPRRVGVSKYTFDNTREDPLRIGRSNNLCNNFLKGKCLWGASCKYAHHSAASDVGKGSANEIFDEKVNDRRNRGASFEHSRNHEPRRTGEIPCNFFAAGNCRNGKFCRFSHLSQTRDVPDDTSQDEWRRQSNNLNNVDQVRDGLKWSDTNVSDVAMLPAWNEDRNTNVGVPEQRDTSWCMDDGCEPSLGTYNRSWDHLTDGEKVVESCERKYLQSKTENTGVGMGVSESRGAENWIGDMEISPAWNYRFPSSNHVVKEEPGHITQTSQSLTQDETDLQTLQMDITREVSPKHHTVAAMQPLIFQNSCFQSNPSLGKDAADVLSCKDREATRDSAMSCIDLNISASVIPRQMLVQNGQSSSAVNQPLSGFNAVGQNRQTCTPYAPRKFINNTQSQQMFQEGKSFAKPDIEDTSRSKVITEIPCSQNIVCREQLSQLTSLTASLGLLFGNGMQLPQLFAALNGSNPMECMPSYLSSSAGPVALPGAASSQPNPAIGSQKQYNPVGDSIELIKPGISNLPAGFAPNSVEERSMADNELAIPSQKSFPSTVNGGPCDGDIYTTGNLEVEPNNKSQQVNNPDPVANCKGDQNDAWGIVAEESKKGQESGPPDKIDGDGGADESKKNSDGKGIRAFKFALVEFVKELLKPTWKEGQISKEAHKTIVKKVVDKVTGSIQGVHMPQSPEKIENYLSSSKPKLSKLVQAYVEKYQKS